MPGWCHYVAYLTDSLLKPSVRLKATLPTVGEDLLLLVSLLPPLMGFKIEFCWIHPVLTNALHTHIRKKEEREIEREKEEFLWESYLCEKRMGTIKIRAHHDQRESGHFAFAIANLLADVLQGGRAGG